MSLWLSKEELIELTGFTRRSRQKMALAQMNIRFISRALDGFPLVSRAQFEAEAVRPGGKREGPRLDFLREPVVRPTRPSRKK